MKVLTVNPGGLENGGGIGRMIGYMVDAWRHKPDAPQFTIMDSRGPGRLDLAALYFAASLVRVAVAGLTSHPLLHVHLAGRGSTLRKVILVHFAALFRLTTVLHLHDYDYAAFISSLPKAAIGPIASMFRTVQAVVVLGQADRTYVLQAFDLDPSRVHVVPNCVPRPLQTRTTDQGNLPVQVLFLGDPSRRKGVHDLLEALASPPLNEGLGSANWEVTIAGGGKELAGFRRMATLKGLDDRVSFPGWLAQDDARRRLAAADILVLPSYAEGLAMSVLEGMSYGLCIVCTPVGALAEVVTDDATGRLVRPGDVAGLADVLKACIQSPDLRQRLGQAAATRFSQQYDADRYPLRMKAVYAAAASAA